jgi:5-carboxymethyl-2-hydroxymuconate isomerase
MKRLLLLTAICIANLTLAQKTTIGLQTFQAINIENWKESEAVTEKIKEVFVKSKRFTVLDRSMYTQTNIFLEKEIQKNIDFINGYVVKQGKSKGAKHIVGGKLLSVTYKTIKDVLKRCYLSFSINVSDVETGELIHSEVISLNLPLPPIPKPGLTNDEALNNTLISLEKKIRAFLEGYVPFYTDIIEIEELEKKKGVELAKTILINAGVDDGINKNDRFGIFEVTYIDTSKGKKKREREIATFKVISVQGELSQGKILSGGEELLKKFNSKKTILVCKSLMKKLIHI